MTKPRLIAALLCLVLTLPAMPCASLAEDTYAEDIVSRCELTYSRSYHKASDMTDNDYNTVWESFKQRSPYVDVKTPNNEPAYGVYLCLGDKVHPWDIKVLENDEWVTVAQATGKYAHEYVALDGLTAFRITPSGNDKMVLSLQEIHVFGAGEIPPWVNLWQDAPDKVDLLVLAAHPDDELLYFGGTIPYYAGEKKMNVLVAYMTGGNKRRRSELLDGLWTCGLKIYPRIWGLPDKYANNSRDILDAWGETRTYMRVVELIRQYKPDVAVTHDTRGEYGHGAHMACASVLRKAAVLAASARQFEASAKTYGVWAVKKVYLHLFKDNTMEMDWDVPLSAFGGKTGFEMAKEAFAHHVSQQKAGKKVSKSGEITYYAVEPRDSKLSCYRFGLAYTTVGEDVLKNDFFEHIPAAQ